MAVDPKRVPGNRVHTKATNIKHIAECSRVYGALARSKYVGGTVISVVNRKANENSQRQTCYVTVEWDFVGGAKRTESGVSQVRAGDPPPAAAVATTPAAATVATARPAVGATPAAAVAATGM